MCIDLRGPDIGVAKQSLHSTDITAATQQFSSKGMTKGMTTGRFANAGRAYSDLYRALHAAHMHVMAYAVAVLIKANAQ